ncbi:MAG: MerR family transcriptional regulator [Steroidobacteraceae bacterium]
MSKEPAKSSATQSIGRLAKAAGVGIDAIRFYERIGLLPTPRRTAAGYRLYAADDQHRLEFIRRAQDLGFSLEEIASLLKLSRPGGSVAQARALAAAKLEVVEGKLAELQRLQHALRALVDECPGSGEAAHCPILAALGGRPQGSHHG